MCVESRVMWSGAPLPAMRGAFACCVIIAAILMRRGAVDPAGRVVRPRVADALGINVPDRVIARLAAVWGVAPDARRARYELTEEATARIARPTMNGPLLRTMEVNRIGGGTMKIEYAHPFALLAWMVSEIPQFAQVLRSMQSQIGNQTWNLLIYEDGATAGNVLKSTAWARPRALELFYWSFLEMGFDRLCSEDYWFLALAVRTKRVDEVEGGLSTILRGLMHEFRRFKFEGCPLPGLASVSADLSGILADGGGHQQLWGWVGASGRKPCFCCYNVYERQREGRLAIVANDPTGLLVSIECTDPQKFLLHTNETIWNVVERIRDFAGGPTARKEQEKDGVEGNY